jgi:polar amino acid transport system permease protein
MVSGQDAGKLEPIGDYIERRPANTLAGVSARAGRWVLRLGALLILAIIIRLLVTSKTLEWGVVGHYFTQHAIVMGALRTLELTAIGMVIGVTIGLILALMRLSTSIVLNLTASLYLWFFRGTPLLVQVLFWFNLASFVKRLSIGIPFGGPTFASASTNSVITTFVAAIVALGLNQGAYMCEVVRAGILSVDPGQMEAGLTLGMTRRTAMRRIVLPQAMRVIIPPTGNHAIALLKDSSLVSVISMTELLYSVQLIYANTFQTIPLLVVACLWYLVMTTVCSIGQFYLERHFGRGATRNAPNTLYDRVLALLRPTPRLPLNDGMPFDDGTGGGTGGVIP